MYEKRYALCAKLGAIQAAKDTAKEAATREFGAILLLACGHHRGNKNTSLEYTSASDSYWVIRQQKEMHDPASILGNKVHTYIHMDRQTDIRQRQTDRHNGTFHVRTVD